MIIHKLQRLQKSGKLFSGHTSINYGRDCVIRQGHQRKTPGRPGFLHLLLLQLLLILLPVLPVFAQTVLHWQEDLLGEPYESAEIVLPDDYEGAVMMTLIRSLAGESPAGQAALYVHGFGDYFFQREMGLWFNEQGYDFYAVDLRKYGRSHRSHQRLANVRDLGEYYEELDRSLAYIRSQGADWIVLIGHSTGGLTTSLYAHDRGEEGLFDALLLNSPFYDFNAGFLTRRVMLPFAAWRGGSSPDTEVEGSGLPSNYSRSIHRDLDGEWEFSREWKPDHTPINYGWIRAIRQGHKRVAGGLEIPVPVLVMLSDHTNSKMEWGDHFFRGDAILSVDQIRSGAEKIESPDRRIEVIKDGMHDLILSPEPVREEAYRVMGRWLESVRPGGRE